MENSNILSETVNDHIIAAAKLVAIKMFTGLDITKPVTLDGNQIFDVINNILKENYQYSIGKFTYYFTVCKTMKDIASQYGVILKLS